MPFRDRFDTLHVTPQNIADTVVEEDGAFRGISLTLAICAGAQTGSFMPILLHEMTHVWQFAQGRRGGHGRDFRNEMLRLGIDEAGQCERDGSPVIRIMLEVQRRYPGLAARMRECLRSPLPSSKQQDFAFFRLLMEGNAMFNRRPEF